MAQITAKTPTEKMAVYQNKNTLERLICDNIYHKRVFDDATWLSVRKENEQRKFLIREDALTRIESRVISSAVESLPYTQFVGSSILSSPTNQIASLADVVLAPD